ncbi:hypothetical protein D0S45_15270 [Marinifilum sp. JC120]|nr:hypothetical protein D0S45_15270 [Marinifilum sp. JC120]
MRKFNKEKYSEGLSMLIDKAYSEYEIWALKIKQTQLRYIRTYLWISSVMVGMEFVFYRDLILKKSQNIILSNVDVVREFWVAFAILSLFFSTSAFVLGLHTLKGKTPTHRAFVDFKDLLHDLYHESYTNQFKVQGKMLYRLENVLKVHQEGCAETGQHLRVLCMLLICSIICFTVTLLCLTYKL